jgi:hypothetical protein
VTSRAGRTRAARFQTAELQCSAFSGNPKGLFRLSASSGTSAGSTRVPARAPEAPVFEPRIPTARFGEQPVGIDPRPGQPSVHDPDQRLGDGPLGPREAARNVQAVSSTLPAIPARSDRSSARTASIIPFALRAIRRPVGATRYVLCRNPSRSTSADRFCVCRFA